MARLASFLLTCHISAIRRSTTVPEGMSDGARRDQRKKLAATLTSHLKAIATDVLAKRASHKPSTEIIAPAHAVVTNLIQMNGRGETPAIVPGPRLVIKLVTAEAASVGSVIPAHISAIRAKFIPAGYRETYTDTNTREWSESDPPRAVQGRHNPESRWYFRVFRAGAIDAAMMVGGRIDDDKDILVDIEPLEARIVEMATRMSEIASAIGSGGPLVIHASLEGLEDVRLSGRQKSKRLGVPFIHLGTIDLSSTAAISIESLRQMLDAVWIVAGFSDGSPLYAEGLTDEMRRTMLAKVETVSGRAWR